MSNNDKKRKRIHKSYLKIVETKRMRRSADDEKLDLLTARSIHHACANKKAQIQYQNAKIHKHNEAKCRHTWAMSVYNAHRYDECEHVFSVYKGHSGFAIEMEKCTVYDIIGVPTSDVKQSLKNQGVRVIDLLPKNLTYDCIENKVTITCIN